MSAPGQMVDPMEARAVMIAPPPAQELDPMEAVAAGQHVSSPPPLPAAPEQSHGIFDPKGKLSSIVRNMTNAATFNLADPAAAALNAVVPIPGYSSTKPTYGERYQEALKAFRGFTREGQEANPVTSLAASVAGGVLNPVSRVLPPATSLMGAIGQGAAIGGGYGLGGSIGNSKDLGDTLKQTAIGAGTGAALAPLSYGIGKLLSGATRTPEAQLLSDEGVPLTPGESLGGTTKTLEDASTHFPVMGNAIKSRQFDAVQGFNRAGYNRVLEPLGIKYAPDGPIGNEGIDELQGLIGKAYDKAYQGASINASAPSLTSGIQQAVADASNTLPQAKVDQLQGNIDRLITSKIASKGALSGDDLQLAKNWFSQQSRPNAMSSLDDRALSDAYGTVVDALKGGIADTDPDKGAMLNAADAAYMRFARIAQAASSNAASAKGGVFTPSQLGAALRTMDNSTRRLDFAKGLAPMQDLAQAGQHVLPSSVPDSGTALRGLLELGVGGALTHAVSPEAAIGGAAALGSGTALYSKPGQAIANALLFGAPGVRKAIGAFPMKALPGALSLAISPSIAKKFGLQLKSPPQSADQSQ